MLTTLKRVHAGCTPGGARALQTRRRATPGLAGSLEFQRVLRVQLFKILTMHAHACVHRAPARARAGDRARETREAIAHASS